MKRLLILGAAMALLAACGEKPQTAGTGPRSEAAAYTGTGKAFVAQGWKPGDKASWESHLKARNAYGQNDYTRTN